MSEAKSETGLRAFIMKCRRLVDTLHTFITICRRFVFRTYLKIVGYNELSEEQALSRAFVVSAIELVGVGLTFLLIKYGPGLFSLRSEPDWQNDCLGISYVLFFTGFGVLVMFALSWFRRWHPSVPEGIILLTFVVNIICFTLAMARTGGPSNSFFGQLVPMQLSGILILEEQKAMVTAGKSTKRRRAWFYAGFSILVWGIVWYYPEHFQGLFHWKELTIKLPPNPTPQNEASLKSYQNSAATFLFTLGMIVTAFAYWFTPRLATSFQRREPKQPIECDAASGTG